MTKGASRTVEHVVSMPFYLAVLNLEAYLLNWQWVSDLSEPGSAERVHDAC